MTLCNVDNTPKKKMKDTKKPIGKRITPTVSNGFQSVEYACGNYTAVGKTVMADLFDTDGNLVRRAVVAECSSDVAARQYVQKKEGDR